MLRPARHDALEQLLAAATGCDRDLDLALMRVGVLAPADLDEIRAILTVDTVSLRAAANIDGHCVLEVSVAHSPWARLHHDGSVELLHSVAA